MPGVPPRSLTVLLLATLGWTPAALAQEPQSFGVERFRPSVMPEALGQVETAEIPAHLEWDVGGFTNYAQDVLVRRSRITGKRDGLVGHRLGGEGAAFLGLFDFVAIGLAAPATVLQLRTADGLVPTPDSLQRLTPIVPGDIRPQFRARLLRQDRHLISVTLAVDATLPTSLGMAYAGEPLPTFSPQVLISRSLLGANVMLNAGVRFRGDRLFGQQSLSDELTLRAGAGYDVGHWLSRVRLMPFVEVSAYTGMGNPLGLGTRRDDGSARNAWAQTGLEAGAGMRWEVIDGLQLVGGMSGGVLPGIGTPSVRVYTGLRFSRRVRDVDGDGLSDRDDLCPASAEDRDGYYDLDGCPEDDNDLDGVPDARDRCPSLAEDPDGFDDADGCPEPDNDGDGVLDVRDACPQDSGVAVARGCPVPDADLDGVQDSQDTCPQAPEDHDGIQDADGCPDEDDDGDGIKDLQDVCPLEAEDADGFEDQDGCQDPDDDGDGVPDVVDACPRQAAPPERAAVGEGCPDGDADADGIPDSLDSCPNDPEDRDGDRDGDGCPDKAPGR